MDPNRMNHYQLNNDGSFRITEYREQTLFYSFLPGIAGIHGIPMWVFYTNRGQCVCSFGIESKDRCIMEYFPANQAAARVELQGFRTFILADKKYYEPFASGSNDRVSMRIGHNNLFLNSINEELGIEVEVEYSIAADCSIGALLRHVFIKNRSGSARRIEFADGMPQMIPCGISSEQFKKEGNTFCAWADTKKLRNGAAFYGIRQSLKDDSNISKPEDGYFCAAFINGTDCPVCVDPAVLFETDASFQNPLGFMKQGVGLLAKNQYTVNRMPCAFAVGEGVLGPGQTMEIDSAYGYAENMEKAFSATQMLYGSMPILKERARQAVSDILDAVRTKTAVREFDSYIEQCYLDNILRGGMPFIFGNRKHPLVHYIFGRKHGDLERDYNEFRLQPEYYSQGNGNYRDLCQNRRNDVLFEPESGLFNIRTFMELIQIDGYNPLAVNGCQYVLKNDDIEKLAGCFKDASIPDLIQATVSGRFSPGLLLHKAEKVRNELSGTPEEFLFRCMYLAEQEVESEHLDGYWSDHFSYNLDLIESYLAVFPDKLVELLYKEGFRFHYSNVRVQPRSKQYTITKNGPRQYNATIRINKEDLDLKEMQQNYLLYRDGRVVEVSLYVKMLCLVLNKFCCIDPAGIGIEMEAGKPGWNDSLNGLPGLMGSGLPETFELVRFIRFLTDTPVQKIQLPMEISDYAFAVNAALEEEDTFVRWNCLGAIRDAFRKNVYDSLSGAYRSTLTSEITPVLTGMLRVLENGVSKAQKLYGPLVPTYLYYEMIDYEIKNGKIIPLNFQTHILPGYLEAPARWMRSLDADSARRLHCIIGNSGLWDKELQMLKVCESLEGTSYELGRARAFEKGWYENESVFLHMTYKYMLGLLSAGAYDIFFEEMLKSFVPFFPPERYGRSIIENCSFIVSSVNPDPKMHGKGFIARLSGATAEVLSIWNILMTGGKPFTFHDDLLYFSLHPKLPSWMFDQSGTVRFTMLGKTEFYILNPSRLDTFAPGMSVFSYEIQWRDGKTIQLKNICGADAIRIRNKEAKTVKANMFQINKT